MLSERSQTEKDKYHMISLICESKKQTNGKNKLIDADNRLVVPEAGMGSGTWGKGVKVGKRHRVPVTR